MKLDDSIQRTIEFVSIDKRPRYASAGVGAISVCVIFFFPDVSMWAKAYFVALLFYALSMFYHTISSFSIHESTIHVRRGPRKLVLHNVSLIKLDFVPYYGFTVLTFICANGRRVRGRFHYLDRSMHEDIVRKIKNACIRTQESQLSVVGYFIKETKRLFAAS